MIVDPQRIRGLPEPALPWPLRWLNRRADRRGFTARLDPGDVLARVAARLGEPPSFPTRVHEALEVFCRSIERDSDLHRWGHFYARNLLVTALTVRAQLDRHFARHPELDAQPLHDPLIVVGLQRSGTTFLHRLLAEDDRGRALPLWEVMLPVPPAGGPDLRRAQITAVFHAFRLTTPRSFDAIHYMRPSLPDECQFLLRLDLRSPVLWTALATFTYGEWLLDQDMTESYRVYRRALQLVQSRSPGMRLTLKNPGHTLHLRELLEVMPEARVVQTHRDPLETLPSQCKLTFTAQAGMTRGVDPARVVATVVRMQQVMAERSVAAERARIHDVDYRALRADPVGVAVGIRGLFGLDTSAALRARMQRHVQANRQYKHGANPYTLEQFGLSAPTLARTFAAYRQRFLGLDETTLTAHP